MMSSTVSDLIVETLKNAGVQRVYDLPGDSLNGELAVCAGSCGPGNLDLMFS